MRLLSRPPQATLPSRRNARLRIIELRITLNPIGSRGKGTIRESVEAYGSFELAMRSRYSGNDQKPGPRLSDLPENSFAASPSR